MGDRRPLHFLSLLYVAVMYYHDIDMEYVLCL